MQHQPIKKEQLKTGKIINSQTLINKQIISMFYRHITSEQRNELSALLRANVKKNKIAKLLSKNRTTIWREIKRTEINGKYYARRAKKLVKEKRIKTNQRFRKIENNKELRKYKL